MIVGVKPYKENHQPIPRLHDHHLRGRERLTLDHVVRPQDPGSHNANARPACSIRGTKIGERNGPHSSHGAEKLLLKGELLGFQT